MIFHNPSKQLNLSIELRRPCVAQHVPRLRKSSKDWQQKQTKNKSKIQQRTKNDQQKKHQLATRRQQQTTSTKSTKKEQPTTNNDADDDDCKSKMPTFGQHSDPVTLLFKLYKHQPDMKNAFWFEQKSHTFHKTVCERFSAWVHVFAEAQLPWASLRLHQCETTISTATSEAQSRRSQSASLQVSRR